MGYRIAVVEEEQELSDRLKKMLEKYAERSTKEWEIVQFSDVDKIPFNAKRCYDVFVIDADGEGLDIARKIHNCDAQSVIILLAEDDRYALDGYSVDAADYLCKPLTESKLASAMERAVFRLGMVSEGSLFLRINHEYTRVMLGDILYIESFGHRIIYHTCRQVYETVGSIKKTVSTLPADNFVRCNSCYIVNLSKVEGVSNDHVVIGRTELKISRPRKRPFMDALTTYFCVT